MLKVRRPSSPRTPLHAKTSATDALDTALSCRNQKNGITGRSICTASDQQPLPVGLMAHRSISTANSEGR